MADGRTKTGKLINQLSQPGRERLTEERTAFGGMFIPNHSGISSHPEFILSGLNDVTLTSPVSANYLRYDGSVWENVTPFDMLTDWNLQVPTFFSLILQGTSPSVTFTDTTGASQDDFQISVNSSSFIIQNTTDARNDLLIDGAGAWTIGGALNVPSITSTGLIKASGAFSNNPMLTLNNTSASTTPSWDINIGNAGNFEGYLKFRSTGSANNFDFALDNTGNPVFQNNSVVAVRGSAVFGANENLNTGFYTNSGAGAIFTGTNYVYIGTSFASQVEILPASMTVNQGAINFDFQQLADDASVIFFGDASTSRFGIGTATPGSKCDVAGSFQCDSITNDTGLAAGTYTPTRSAEANMDSNATMTEAQYMRVGNTVTVSGRFTADPTTPATTTSFEITLPVASNIGAVEDCAGVAFCGSIAAQGAEVYGSVANNTAVITWKAGDVTSQTWSYTFTYQVI